MSAIINSSTEWVLGVEGSVDGATLTKNVLILAPSIVGQALNFGTPLLAAR